ncbi:ABC transporter substrate-binding protein [Luteococcus peritonei]|uniref:ABC transporter substrate-binding protein n=1 Tax=Luteococcus peritonei TaxID=88874 RepID=A0ABW4RUB5_9ACTN
MDTSTTKLSRRGLLAGGGLGALAPALSACDANGRSTGASSSASASKGGTMTILTSATDVNFDPAKSQSMAVTSLGLVHRRLTSWKITPGGEAEVVPDLATDTGTVSKDGLTWTYTLKDGARMEDGKPVTAAMVKNGLERSFSSTLSGGLGYHKALLADTKGYQGPSGGKHLASIETPDDKTLVFHLEHPYGDWPWIASTPAFAPVPEGADATSYARKPVASGPYRVAEYKQGSSVRLERNAQWSADNDQVRTAMPDVITFSLGQDESVVSQRLIADAGADRNAFGADLVAAAQLAQISSNPSAKGRLATSSAGPLQYLAINTTRITDLDVRKAIALAVDKAAVISALGGELGAVVATTFITPGIPGREEFDLFPTDVDKAKQLLAGKKVPALTLLAQNGAAPSAIAQAVAQSLTEAGLTVNIAPVESDTWTERATQGNGSGYDLAIASWNPDYPSANANLQPLFASSEIGQGGYNISRWSDQAIDAAIRDATENPDAEAAKKQWAAIDRRIAEQVPAVPLAYRRNSFLHGSGVSNFFVEPFPAYPNYLVLGVSAS